VSARLQVQDVVRAFDGVRAVDGATLEVEPGSITGLIGPNGAGKSTLFNCVSGFLRPDAGRVLLDGKRIDRRAPHRIARSGLVRTFQTPRALTRMTVLENVVLAAPRHGGERLGGSLFPRARRREREARGRAAELLELVRLTSHADALAGTLSGGQRKLLELVRALMAKPRILLLDEPMAGVSPTLRVELLEHILALRDRDGITLLVVEHDLDFIMGASDRVIVMNDGAVIAQGSPDDVRADERVVDAYLGARHHAEGA
jgi:neutral amino acid transport system ATP-binding protein